jgi:hypothetical protein
VIGAQHKIHRFHPCGGFHLHESHLTCTIVEHKVCNNIFHSEIPHHASTYSLDRLVFTSIVTQDRLGALLFDDNFNKTVYLY